MKQRKKIKYVQKRPQEKNQYSKNEQQVISQKEQTKTQQKKVQINQKRKVEIHHSTKEAHLIDQKDKKNENWEKQNRQKPKYYPRNEQQNASQQSSYKKYEKKEIPLKAKYEQRRRQEDLQAPSKYNEKKSSHYQFQCIICSEQIHRKHYIWTCQCCSISMHLKCIKQWIMNINNELDKKSRVIFDWRCPQCNFQYNEPMPKYYCFCGKYLNPELDRDFEPHSCGKICNKKRGVFCHHPCPDICHRGKCKPCDFEGANVTCQCGKSQRLVKCSQQRQAFQCGKKCQKILNCHKHKCERNCHYGDCQPCKKKHMVGCHCGKNDDVVDCIQVSYSCGQVCGKLLECGYHTCEEKCHLGQCRKCHKTPQLQKNCSCGKYTIEMLTGDPEYRKTCSDIIPSCGMPCGKKQQCGHICPRSCHEGQCPPCKMVIDQSCNCELKSRKIECWKHLKELFRCQNVCKKRRSCGIHACNTQCCKYRLSPIIDNHPCDLTCNKKLNCEKHQCGESCHIGLCKKCPVIYSQPQPCPCGKTTLKPPIICGTIVPECNNICGKEMPCGHICKNQCHYGNCRCYEDVAVSCRCGKSKINTTCGKQALCLVKCQNILDCGHKCDLQCHKGTCLQAHKINPCRKPCNKERSDCHHICPQICHPPKKCELYSCEAQILIKCECGHRQTATLCGAIDNHKVKKQIICNKKCQNLKRFDTLYKDKQIYYPSNMIQFAFKNFAYLQNLESKLERFILHSEQSFIQVQYKFPDNSTKILLLNLFENHYHLNTHFYRYRKYASFTLMQSENTMIPKPVLSEYIKLVAKGTIKRNNLPFQFTISFQSDQKQKSDLVLKSIKIYLHKYYSERKDKYISLHFWSKEQGEEALRSLQNQYQTIQFRSSYNIIKNQDEIKESQIVEKQFQQNLQQEPKQHVQLQNQKIDANKLKQEKSVEHRQEIKGQVITEKVQKKQEIQTFKAALIQKNEQKGQRSQPRLIIRKGIPNFKKRDYPQSKQNIQDIYLLDQDELYSEEINWQKFIVDLISKNMGPQATQWRIRALLMINSFQSVSEQQFHDQFTKIVSFYAKDKLDTCRILQIQRIENKSVKQQMSSNNIYLSDHEPEIMGYYYIYNYIAEQKIDHNLSEILLETPEVNKAKQAIDYIEANDYKQFYHIFSSSDYIFGCALIPLVHIIRENLFDHLDSKSKIQAKSLAQYLLFESELQFLQFCHQNGYTLERRTSKTTKQQYYYLNQKGAQTKRQKDLSFIKSKVETKRNKKYFLNEPEELVNGQYMTRSFFAFGDFKESINPKYMLQLIKQLKTKE